MLSLMSKVPNIDFKGVVARRMIFKQNGQGEETLEPFLVHKINSSSLENSSEG